MQLTASLQGWLYLTHTDTHTHTHTDTHQAIDPSTNQSTDTSGRVTSPSALLRDDVWLSQVRPSVGSGELGFPFLVCKTAQRGTGMCSPTAPLPCFCPGVYELGFQCPAPCGQQGGHSAPALTSAWVEGGGRGAKGGLLLATQYLAAAPDSKSC